MENFLVGFLVIWMTGVIPALMAYERLDDAVLWPFILLVGICKRAVYWIAK